MKYIETEDNVTRTYEVDIDMDKLNEVLALLDKDCYVRKYGERTTEAHFDSEANEKISNMTNHAGIKENEAYKLLSLTKGPYWYHGLPLDASYMALYKDSVELVKRIDWLLTIKDEKHMEKYCIEELDRIKDYANSPDFIPFEQRLEVATNILNKSLETKDESIMDDLNNYTTALIEAKLNPNYNYHRLAELYIEVLKCFKFNLVEEKIKYTR